MSTKRGGNCNGCEAKYTCKQCGAKCCIHYCGGINWTTKETTCGTCIDEMVKSRNQHHEREGGVEG